MTNGLQALTGRLKRKQKRMVYGKVWSYPLPVRTWLRSLLNGIGLAIAAALCSGPLALFIAIVALAYLIPALLKMTAREKIKVFLDRVVTAEVSPWLSRFRRQIPIRDIRCFAPYMCMDGLRIGVLTHDNRLLRLGVYTPPGKKFGPILRAVTTYAELEAPRIEHIFGDGPPVCPDSLHARPLGETTRYRAFKWLWKEISPLDFIPIINLLSVALKNRFRHPVEPPYFIVWIAVLVLFSVAPLVLFSGILYEYHLSDTELTKHLRGLPFLTLGRAPREGLKSIELGGAGKLFFNYESRAVRKISAFPFDNHAARRFLYEIGQHFEVPTNLAAIVEAAKAEVLGKPDPTTPVKD